MSMYSCIENSIFCPTCNNRDNDDLHTMCDMCYDDMSIMYDCKYCDQINKYYNSLSLCKKYILCSNLIKQKYKKYKLRKNIRLYSYTLLKKYCNPNSKALLYKVRNYDNKKKEMIMLNKKNELIKYNFK